MKSESARITSRGRVVIPARLRRKYGLKEGTRLNFSEEEDRFAVQPVTKEYISSFRGIFKTKPGKNPPCGNCWRTVPRSGPAKTGRSLLRVHSWSSLPCFCAF